MTESDRILCYGEGKTVFSIFGIFSEITQEIGDLSGNQEHCFQMSVTKEKMYGTGGRKARISLLWRIYLFLWKKLYAKSGPLG